MLSERFLQMLMESKQRVWAERAEQARKARPANPARTWSWTEEQERTLREMFAVGASDEEIAAALGKSIHAVRQKRRRMGLIRDASKRKKRSCDWTDEEERILREMFAKGCTDAEIAKALGKSVSAVKSKRSREGLKKRV